MKLILMNFRKYCVNLRSLNLGELIFYIWKIKKKITRTSKLQQESKGIRQWSINLRTQPKIFHKISPSADYNQLLKGLDLSIFKSPKVLSLQISKRYYKTLGFRSNIETITFLRFKYNEIYENKYKVKAI